MTTPSDKQTDNQPALQPPEPESSPDYQSGFEAGCAFTIATLEENLWHLNYVFDGIECCKRCALVRPATGWIRPCKGPHGISLRARVDGGVATVDDDAVIQLLLDWRKWYGEDIFTPWTIEEAQRVHAQFPGAVDRVAADSARGTVDRIIEDIRAGKHRETKTLSKAED